MSMGVSRASGKQSLCWECKNISCTWIKSRKPVKGWKAKETVITIPKKILKVTTLPNVRNLRPQEKWNR